MCGIPEVKEVGGQRVFNINKFLSGLLHYCIKSRLIDLTCISIFPPVKYFKKSKFQKY